MNTRMKELYFRRALKKKHAKRPPKRLPRPLFPERIEAQYERELIDVLKFARDRVNALVKPMIPKLAAHYGRVRKDGADETDKYYTAFIYPKSWANADVLHCTHKYLGPLSRADVLQVEKVIDAYFLKPRELPHVTFDREEFFGPAKDIRVLTPEAYRPSEFFPDLRASLDRFRKDDFPEYRPHVTASMLTAIDDPFASFALISKAGVKRIWPAEYRQDADDTLEDLASQLERIRIETTQEFSPSELRKLARLTGDSVADWNAKQMNKQLQGIVEIDLFGSGGEPWLAREMGAFVAQNVDLITSIPEDYLGQLSKMIATSIRSGLRVEDIADEIDDRYEVGESRARLIARDQVGKFNGQLTELRQKDLGIDEYVRRGVGDARERDSHRVLNDKTFSWDDPPSVGHPGEDYQCRCWAEPALAKLYDDEHN